MAQELGDFIEAAGLLEYDPAAIRLVNTGATWRMDFQSEGSNLSGGPLEGSYKGGDHKYRYTAKLCESSKTIISCA